MIERLAEMAGVGGSVVDLGCGSGRLLDQLSGKFERRIGLDISRNRLDKLANGIVDGWDFLQADLNGDFPLQDASVDVVTANQVIEHIVDPQKFAFEIHRVLRPGGLCLLTTPNIRYIKNVARIALYGLGPKTAGGNTLDGTWDDGHIHYFTHRDIRSILAGVGFGDIDSRALINLSNASLARRLLDSASSSWVVRELLSGNMLVAARKCEKQPSIACDLRDDS